MLKLISQRKAVSKSIWSNNHTLAVAATLTLALGFSAHAQTSNLVAAAVTTGASSGISSSSDSASNLADSPAPTAAVAAPAETGAGQSRYGIVYRQEQTPGSGYLHVHGLDIAGLATGRYQTSVTHQSPNLAGTTEGVGFLGSIREHPVSWFGLEVNYGYNRYTEHYRVVPAGGPVNDVQLQQNEATAGYVFHIKTPYVQPFIVLGGGGINFSPILATTILPTQWRGAAMYEVGLDFIPNKHQPHVGFRVQEHGLFYKAPDFYVASFRSNAWVHQALPSAGVFYRF